MLTKATCISSILLFLVVGAFAVDAKDNADWEVYLGGKERNLYSTLKQINRDNVAELQVAWSYETGDKAEYQANNLIVDGLLYTPTPSRKVVALDAATGEVLWEQILNSTAGGFPVSYRVDGVQYIAIAVGGGPNALILTPEIRQRSGGNTLFVFRLR